MADINTVADTVASDAISQIQNLMVSMSAGCAGGPGGVPPVSVSRETPRLCRGQ